MIKRIASIVLYILIPVSVFLLLGFAVESNKSMPCRSFRVVIDHQHGMMFVDSAEVVEKVYALMDTLEGRIIKDISLNRIAERINAMYYVKNCRIYRSIDGHVVANINQRVPLVRVVNSLNETYYIDNTGRLMKTSHKFTARVPVATGFIHTRYAHDFSLEELAGNNNLSRSDKVIRDLNGMIKFIQEDSFWSAWIDQVYVTRMGEFELIPRNGAHVVEFGSVEDMEEKFEKLLKFYKNGLTHVGWTSYSKINLKYKNQVVCSK